MDLLLDPAFFQMDHETLRSLAFHPEKIFKKIGTCEKLAGGITSWNEM
jgi:hypothetical protein